MNRANVNKSTQVRFSKSILWKLQKRYFSEKGIEAWSSGEVPHYITNNVFISNSYAELIMAFLEDTNCVNAAVVKPFYVLELGAGSGRFAYHFLNQFTKISEKKGLSLNNFRYILTDISDKNIEFWINHPKFQPFFQQRVLDVGFYDVTKNAEIYLYLARETLSPYQLDNPLIVIANYFFDSIPQELIYFRQQVGYQCFVHFNSSDFSEKNISEIIKELSFDIEHEEIQENFFDDPHLQKLLIEYSKKLNEAYVLFPSDGIKCIEQLSSLSKNGLLLLLADKGITEMTHWEGEPVPELMCHGSFSLKVNFHAIKQYFQLKGGRTWISTKNWEHMYVGCFAMGGQNWKYSQLKKTFSKCVNEFGPIDYYKLTKEINNKIAQLSFDEIICYLETYYLDSHQYVKCLPRLIELVRNCIPKEKEQLSELIEKIWDRYYPIMEEIDLAYYTACLFYEMDYYEQAITYFDRSIKYYGKFSGTLYNKAVCHNFIGESKTAIVLLEKVLSTEPENIEAMTLYLQIMSTHSL